MPRPDPGQVAQAAKRQFAAQYGRFFLWSPLPVMAGIMLFFALPQDPPLGTGPVVLALLAIIWRAMRRRRPVYLLLLPALLALAGFAAAQYRTLGLAMPLIAQELRYREVEGQVERMEPQDKKIKLTLREVRIEGLEPQNTPPRVNVTLRGEQPAFGAGDRIRLKAQLYPLPAPVLPGGFDFARHFYFNGIGGTGYALSKIQVVEYTEKSMWNVKINNLRHKIGENMRNSMANPQGAVAAAMTIGEAGPIPEKVNDSLRDAGLYHIISISGFHLAVVTGLAFAALRLLLSLWPALALRVNAKKLAGIVALLAAYAYLALAGFPLPAQRSFIMVAFVFLAILFDRRGLSLRSLCFAALFILLAFPESLYSASFQLSFAATLAIVSLYENWPLPRPRRLIGRLGMYILGILATSLAASLATAPFIIYGFNRLSLLGMLSNMLVLPLASMVIMPAIVAALLLMPLGLQELAYVPLQWGTGLMLAVADAASAWPLASISLPSLSHAGVLLAALGLLWLCLWRGRLRLLGLPMLALALATIGQHRPVDVFVSDGAKQVIVRLENGEYTALKGTSRAYAVETWLQSEGKDALVPLKQSGIPCDEKTCTYSKAGKTLVMVTKAEGDEVLNMACARAPDVLVAPRWLKAARCPQPNQLIGKNELTVHGPHALYMEEGGITTARTREGGARRMWQPPLPEGSQGKSAQAQ